MRKVNLLIGIGALALASCSNEDLVVDQTGTQGSTEPIGFSIATPNMGRGTFGLETKHVDFGVWAYKGDSEAAVTAGAGANTVMNNYVVGYWGGSAGVEQGYKPLLGQLTRTDGSAWWYEGLGKLQDVEHTLDGVTSSAAWEFIAYDGVQATAATPVNDYQYLKYWDLSKTYTYFYTCSPYNIATWDHTAKTLTFPAIDNTGTGQEWMFAAKRQANASAAKVNLEFQRMSAQIRIAFIEELVGYDVELIDLYTNNGKTYEGIYLQPADEPATAGDPYTKGSFAVSGTPVVTFTENDANTATGIDWAISFNNLSTDDAPINVNINNFYNVTAPATPTKVVGADFDHRLVGPIHNVIPASMGTGEANSGFTMMASFKLTAKDTGEVTYVYGAKVYVAPTYTQWLPNTLYTYVFRITSQMPGSTDDSDPDPNDPTPSDPALLPIIFDNVVVGDYEVVYKYFPGI